MHALQPGANGADAALRCTEFQPGPDAARIIDRWYLVENAGQHALPFPVVADATGDLLFDLDHPGRVAVTRSMRQPFPLWVPPGTRCLGVRMVAGALRRWEGFQGACPDGMVRFLAPSDSAFHADAWRRASDPIRFARMLEMRIVERVSRYPHHPLVAAALEQLHAPQHTHLPIEALARGIGVSDRQLRRLFLTEVGVTPVVFRRIRRMQTALSMLRQEALNIVDVAHASGYADQAQMTHDFRALTRMPPGHWRVRFQQDGVQGDG